MPFTVITVKNVSPSLRGDLTKWMQEIATGVYVGNFNVRVREKLWNRVKDSAGGGEATISYSFKNEIGYYFNTINAQREVIDYDGIPLILLSKTRNDVDDSMKLGFSNAAKNRKARKYSSVQSKTNHKPYVVLDIETDGLDEYENSIIEIGSLKIGNSEVYEFNYLIKYEHKLPKSITALTGITQDLLDNKGEPLNIVLDAFLKFVGDLDIVGYGIEFDIRFINNKLRKLGKPLLRNKRHDLMKYVKSEKLFLKNYKLQTVLREYGIDGNVPHRALPDSKLLYELSTKVNEFSKKINKD